MITRGTTTVTSTATTAIASIATTTAIRAAKRTRARTKRYFQISKFNYLAAIVVFACIYSSGISNNNNNNSKNS